MEHESSKTGAESLRKQEVTDMISELPRDLIIEILSSLSTKDVTATSVLSKSWRSLWKMVPNIKFDSRNDHDKSDESHSFSEIVCKSLLSCSYPVLESLYLVNIYESVASEEIEILIGVAFARPVRKLVLRWDERDLIRFPSVFCSCNTLEMLELSTMLLDFPCRVGLKSLKTLHLINVKFRGEESVCNLLCGCPSLEDLTVERRNNYDAETFTIAVPSLQRLTIVDTFLGKANGGYVINAPSLKYLTIKGVVVGLLSACWRVDDFYRVFRIENATELVEAKIVGIITDIQVHNDVILATLTSAKRLSLYFSHWKQIKCPTGITFYQLVSLELNTRSSEWSSLLARMLDTSPNLQILKLIYDANEYNNNNRELFFYQLTGEWEKRPKCVPECLLFHLVTFQWTNYYWEQEEDQVVAKYILKNARWLKKATFYTERDHVETLEEKREMLN